jgi:hypothetical protein
VKLFLYLTMILSTMPHCLIKHHAVITYWGVEVYVHAFLTAALDGGEWSVPRIEMKISLLLI